ncbi:MAG: hypothetical protein ABR553_02110 [Gammaproteobacteria bacterium]
MNSATARVGDLPVAWRVPLLMLGFVSLLSGILAGLARLGWAVPLPAPQTLVLHGPLMISGFFGTVIGLERAVALGRRWAYAGALFSGLGGLSLVIGLPPAVGAAAMSLGSGVLLAATLVIVGRQRETFTVTLALGAASGLAGNLLWLFGVAPAAVVALWLNFLVLTIAGERLELSRFLPPSVNARRLFPLIVAVLLVGSLAVLAGRGVPLYGLGLLALAAWLLRQDIARRTVRERGQTRFIAVCLLSGYLWLAVGGLILLVAGGFQGRGYDAALHALLLGFVFSMVFGHAPIIFPAVVRVRMPWQPSAYLPLSVLHASLAVRLAGDALGQVALIAWGGLLNALALALFIAVTLASVIRGARRSRTQAP